MIFPFNWIVWFMSFFIGGNREDFAPLPLYVRHVYELQLIRTQIALCDLQSREEKLKDNRMWGNGGKVSKPGSWASSTTNREALWNKLCESL